jgi:hypothetical protein
MMTCLIVSSMFGSLTRSKNSCFNRISLDCQKIVRNRFFKALQSTCQVSPIHVIWATTKSHFVVHMCTLVLLYLKIDRFDQF